MNEQFAQNPQLAEKYPQASKALAGKSQELITFVTDRAGHDQRYAINPTKSNVELGYKPIINFEKGIAITMEWFLDNEEWWISK